MTASVFPNDDSLERQVDPSPVADPLRVHETIQVMNLQRRLHGVPHEQVADDRRTYERRMAAIEKRKRRG
jgi:hypothetical protein